MNQTSPKIVVFDNKMMAAKEYWITRLSQEIGDSNLRLDYPRPDSYQGETSAVEVNITGEIYQKLNKLTGESSFLLYTILMAILKICLHKYTGSITIVVGSPARGKSSGSRVLGNALAIVDKVERELSFRQFLLNVRQTLLDAYKNQHYPFERVVQDFDLEYVEHKCPLFDVALVLTDIHSDMLPVKNDMTMMFSKVPEGVVSGRIKFNSTLFKRESIERFSGHFINVLRDTLENTNVLVSELQLATEAEQHQLLIEWNNTKTAYPYDKCIPALFEFQAEQNPSAAAVVFNDEKLSYLELNARANQIACYLQAMGVGPDVLVGVCVDRSLEMVAGLLGILKAGGAYVPLDPEYPKERINFILADAGVSVLLTIKDYRHKIEDCLSSIVNPTMVYLDTDGSVISKQEKRNPSSGVKPENLAYVIYTSGTTGKPKGVPIIHRSVCNLVNAQIRRFDVRSDSRVLQFASFSFDASVSEIFMALCSGAMLCLETKEALLPGATLTRLLEERGITHVTLPPSTLAVLPHEELSALRSIIVAGEACHGDLVAKWSKDRRFFNAYGPTETTVCATIAECGNTARKPPIGRPIDNTQIYILDTDFHPVPIGVPGELYIGGVGLSQGYLNRPELNAEKFILNPFSDEPGARLYRSGDLVCRLADGNIDFIGRVDHQIKVRGFRIEPEEIEAVLATHPGVRDNVVIVREDHPSDQRLVAYFVPHQEPVTSSVLRDFLRERLPDYMIPSSFVMLESLPLTPNKKVDRRALPAPDVHRRDEKSTICPRDNVELRLVQIWEEILEVSPVSVKDDFFELGGYSLLAVRLMSQIQQQFGKNLPLTVLFQHSTIEQLAGVLHLQVDTLPWSPLIAIQPNGSKQPLFCVHPAGGRVLCYIDLARYLGPDQPFYGLQAWGLEEGQKPFTRAKDMAACYIEALRAVQPHGPYHLAGWSGGGIVAFEMAQQFQSEGEQVSFLAVLDAYSPSILPDDLYKQDDAQIIMNLLREDIPSLSVDYMRHMTSDELLAYVTKQLIAANLIPPDFGIDHVQRFLNVYKANNQAAHSSISQYYQGKIILMRAKEEISTASLYSPHDQTLGWGAFATEGVEICWVPGNHNTMMNKPHVEVLAKQLRYYLEDQDRTYALTN